jgi:hypothetical protein
VLVLREHRVCVLGLRLVPFSAREFGCTSRSARRVGRGPHRRHGSGARAGHREVAADSFGEVVGRKPSRETIAPCWRSLDPSARSQLLPRWPRPVIHEEAGLCQGHGVRGIGRLAAGGGGGFDGDASGGVSGRPERASMRTLCALSWQTYMWCGLGACDRSTCGVCARAAKPVDEIKRRRFAEAASAGRPGRRRGVSRGRDQPQRGAQAPPPVRRSNGSARSL